MIEHKKEAKPEELSLLLIPFLETKGYKVSADKRLVNIIKGFQERSKTLVEMAGAAEFYFKEDIQYEEDAAKKFLTPDMATIFEILISRLNSLQALTHEAIEAIFNDIINEKGLKLGKVAQPVRIALTGGKVSPGIFEVIENLGKETTIKRIKKAIEFIKSRN